MNKYEAIRSYNDLVYSISQEENLACLRGKDNDYQLKDKQVLSWHSEITRKCRIKYQYDSFSNIDDLLLYSDEIMHFTAQLYLLRPYINNPLEDGFWASNKMIYPYNENMEAKRYSMYSDIICEKLYNYWHRLGDLISSFFPDLISPKRVYFPTAFDIIPNEFHHLESYKWLKEHRENLYKGLNTIRKTIVHYKSTNTKQKYDHLKLVYDREKMKEWVQQRFDRPDFFKNEINIAIEGFYQTLTMLKEINKTLFKEVN